MECMGFHCYNQNYKLSTLEKLDQGFNGTVEIRTFPSLNGESLEITLTVPLTLCFPKRHSEAKNYNGKIVISEMYASFVLQCTVSGR